MIQRITLRNFRNFEEADFDLSASSTVFTGRNGTGKSSVLEAVYFFSSLRSFRTPTSKELKKIGTGGFFLKLQDKSSDGWKSELKIDWSKERRLYIDDVSVARASDFIGRFRIVTFLPDDDTLITGGPSYRRKFMDRYLCMTDPEYMRLLLEYSGALKNYNYLLKNRIFDRSQLLPFGKIMSSAAGPIREKRMSASDLFSERAGKILLEIRPEMKDLLIKPVWEGEAASPEEFLALLTENMTKDCERGFCSAGCHRDDFRIMINNMLLRDYGSRGQCRITALSMKLAEYSLLSELFPGNVKVIADDALSDLDQITKDLFLERISTAEQIFYAFPELPSDRHFQNSRVISLDAG